MAIHHAEPAEIVDMRPLGARLNATKTTAITKTDHFEAMRIVVSAGTEIDSHAVDGEMTLLCVEGDIRLGLTGRDVTMRAGDWLYLKGGEPHSISARADSSLLLTILFNR